MRKPSNDDFEKFGEVFAAESHQAGKKQYLVPYFIASHPGSDLDAMIDLAVFLKQNGYQPDQVQDFIPAPFDVATAMYYTGIDPFTKKPVYVARHLRDRKLQRALMQFFKPENYFEVREALIKAKRTDLIGDGCDCLIPSRPPREAVERRKRRSERILPRRVRPYDPRGESSEAGETQGIAPCASPRLSTRTASGLRRATGACAGSLPLPRIDHGQGIKRIRCEASFWRVYTSASATT